MAWLLCVVMILSSVSVFAAAAGTGPAPTGLLRGSLVCPPSMQLRQPGRCPAIGTGAKLIELARKGVYPAHPLPVAHVDPDLGYLEYGFIRVGDVANLYPSSDDAANSSASTGRVGPGFVYLSQRGPINRDGQVVYAAEAGFVRAEQVSQVKPSTFHGLAFSRTPQRSFGWIIQGGTCPSRTPGGDPNYDEICYTHFDVVQVYETQHVGEWDWYLVAPGRWLDQRAVAIVDPDPTPPPGVNDTRWISVNLYEQTVAAYQDGQLVYATAASTGRYGFWTKPGLFQVWVKLQRDLMTGGVPSEDGSSFYYLEAVPWVLYFDEARALHGTYWHNKFGSVTSRGCVNLSIADARWFYDFAQEGTWVYVWDPSGKTPVDPEAYGEGGA